MKAIEGSTICDLTRRDSTALWRITLKYMEKQLSLRLRQGWGEFFLSKLGSYNSGRVIPTTCYNSWEKSFD